MSFLERFLASNWNLEFICIGSILIMATLIKLGDLYNQRLVKNFLSGISEVIKKNFYQYGVSETELYKKDSSENFTSYATGRVNIASVKIDFRLQPRQNVFVWIAETLMSFFTTSVQKPTDRVDITITPSSEYDNFISSIVSKVGMDNHRKYNYFLSLTKTTDSNSLPESFVFMCESNEFQDKILSEQLKSSLTLESASYLRYISFTDQPTERPEILRDLIPRRRIVISANLTSKKNHLKQIEQILDATFNIVDRLASKEIKLSSEAIKKVVKTRENEVAKIKKIEDEIKQEQLAEEKAKLRREEKNRLRNLSSEEQLKLEKKAAEKKQRKLQKKQRVRM